MGCLPLPVGVDLVLIATLASDKAICLQRIIGETDVWWSADAITHHSPDIAMPYSDDFQRLRDKKYKLNAC